MNVIDAINQRRAVKHFDVNHRLTPQEEELLFKTAIQSPTAFNIQHWRFVVVRDQGLRQAICQAAWDQAQVTDASLLIILCADIKAWEKEPVRYWKNAPNEVQSFMLPAIDAYYRDKDQVQRDEVMRSCGILGQSLMLTAKAMGFDSCPMDGFDYDRVGQIIKLPEDHVISFMVTIGKKVKEAWPKPGQLPLGEVLIENHW